MEPWFPTTISHMKKGVWVLNGNRKFFKNRSESHIFHEVVHCEHTNIRSVLEQILDSIYIAEKKGVNWAHTVEIEMSKVEYPDTEDMIQELVRENKRVRCLGAFHSSAPIVGK